jgi:hypothetical protein
MPWLGDMNEFVEEAAKVRDAGVFDKELRSVPDNRWAEVHGLLKVRLDQVVPGEPESPPLTRGEGRGVEVLSSRQLEQQARDLDAKRAALEAEARRRGG